MKCSHVDSMIHVARKFGGSFSRPISPLWERTWLGKVVGERALQGGQSSTWANTQDST